MKGNLPILTIPTTAGTGSEVTQYAVLVDPSENTKRTIGGKGLFPVVAMLDPDLTVSMPRDVTINTGLDALSQALEGMLSRRATELGDMMALEICRLVKQWLPIAADSPQDVDARAGMMHAAMLSGCVIAQSGTTLVHGMGYYYTMEFGVPHGLANALLLPPIFAYNARHLPGKVAALAEALAFPAPAEPEGAAHAIQQALRALMDRVGVSGAAREHGVHEERLEWCAQEVFRDRSRFKNQVGEPTLDEVRGFFQAAQNAT
jgi:alcohol dehydrogenase class IV